MDLLINIGSLPRDGNDMELTVKKEDISVGEIVGDVCLTLGIHKIGNSYDLRGFMEYDLSLMCSRCLKEIKQHEKRNFQMRFKEKADSAVSRKFKTDADGTENEYLVVKNCINLGPFLRDELILSLPKKPLCREKCLGLCPVCGIDLNCDSCEHCKTTKKSLARLKSRRNK
jgi:uncharacterized protein